jgi:hypothetical protein
MAHRRKLKGLSAFGAPANRLLLSFDRRATKNISFGTAQMPPDSR